MGVVVACMLVACGGRSARIDAEDRENGGSGGRSGAVGPVCEQTGGRASDGFEIRFANASDRITSVVDRDDGSLIGYRAGNLVHVDRNGGVSALPFAPEFAKEIEGGTSSQLAPRGQALAVHTHRGEVSVLDGNGARLLSRITAPDGIDIIGFRFSGSGELLSLTYGDLGLDRSFPTTVEVRRLDGSVISSVPYEGPREPVIPASDDRMFWPPGASGRELWATTLDGVELYRVEVPTELVTLRVSDDGNTLVLALYGNEIWHVVDGEILPTYLPDAAVSQLKLAPGGRWSSFSHYAPARIHLFDSGEWLNGAALPLARVDGFDVSDDGFVIAGGEDENDGPRALLLDSNLDVQFTCSGTSGDGTPTVRFTRDGRRAIAIFNDRLSVFGVK